MNSVNGNTPDSDLWRVRWCHEVPCPMARDHRLGVETWNDEETRFYCAGNSSFSDITDFAKNFEWTIIFGHSFLLPSGSLKSLVVIETHCCPVS